MTARGRARLQTLAIWFGGMMASALTATAAVAFFFGGEFAKVDNNGEQITTLEARTNSISDTIHRLDRANADTYQTQRGSREMERRLEARLTRIEDKLDCALDLVSCRR